MSEVDHARQPLQAVDFVNGMTVAELKAVVCDWPETDEYDNQCEVWVCDGQGLSSPVTSVMPLNARQSTDGSSLWADFMLGHG